MFVYLQVSALNMQPSGRSAVWRLFLIIDRQSLSLIKTRYMHSYICMHVNIIIAILKAATLLTTYVHTYVYYFSKIFNHLCARNGVNGFGLLTLKVFSQIL